MIVYSHAIIGLMSDVRGTALTRLQALEFDKFEDLAVAAKVLDQIKDCERLIEDAYKSIMEILNTM